MYYLVLTALLSPQLAPAPTVRGQYVEARTCDVFTGECFANADTGLAGKHAVLAWKIETGTVGGTRIDGLGVVAVVAAGDTLGRTQGVTGRAVVLVDEKATTAQREALVAFVKSQAGDLAREVVTVRPTKFDLTICGCDEEGCATLSTREVTVTTRCLNAAHDRACGNEATLYPPLAKGVTAKAAMASEHTFKGTGLSETWTDHDRRGAFVGSFAAR